ncbi:MAG: tRNA (N(6)-L-threonylcarbamoyladenosine(37)-C(2))-methylthiotransferase MtaB [Nitrospinales bacterium]
MKVAFTTLGCRSNQHDTAEMQTLLEHDGFRIVDAREKADVYVVNSCTVTGKSDYSSRLAVKKSLGINENARVVFTGCYAQNSPAEVAEIPGLDLVLGNADKLDIASAIKRLLTAARTGEPPAAEKPGAPLVRMSDLSRSRVFTTVPVTHFPGKTKAFIKVQTGCDERCSFCTVVKARGRSLSDARANVLRNVQTAADAGYKEITLTGINLGTYGMDFDVPQTFSALVADVMKLPGDFRVRLSSINPMEIDDALIRLIAEHENLCPHLHVPLQSGDDSVLARMRRNYRSQQYLDAVHRALDAIPNLGLGADVIVGFPGETDAMFENTLKLVESLPFSYLHVFSYSGRKGTEAYSLKDAVPKAVKKMRHKLLTDLGNRKALQFRRRFLGRTVSVLIETRADPVSGLFRGRSEHYIPVSVSGGEAFVNRIVPVTVEQVSERQVSGCVPS